MSSAKYRRLLLKVSGEMLAGEQGYGIQPSILEHLAEEIASVVALDVQVAIVIGGGNIFRGIAASASGAPSGAEARASGSPKPWEETLRGLPAGSNRRRRPSSVVTAVRPLGPMASSSTAESSSRRQTHRPAVVARPTRPQQGETEDFLTGLYSGLAAASVPSVGVEDSNAQPSAVPPFRAAGLATVDALDTTAGQVALVFLLEGARPGSYGLGQDAVDGVLPAAPLTAPGE